MKKMERSQRHTINKYQSNLLKTLFSPKMIKMIKNLNQANLMRTMTILILMTAKMRKMNRLKLTNVKSL